MQCGSDRRCAVCTLHVFSVVSDVTAGGRQPATRLGWRQRRQGLVPGGADHPAGGVRLTDHARRLGGVPAHRAGGARLSRLEQARQTHPLTQRGRLHQEVQPGEEGPAHAS